MLNLIIGLVIGWFAASWYAGVTTKDLQDNDDE